MACIVAVVVTYVVIMFLSMIAVNWIAGLLGWDRIDREMISGLMIVWPVGWIGMALCLIWRAANEVSYACKKFPAWALKTYLRYKFREFN